MLLTIRHRTQYSYDAPQNRFTQSLRLTPAPSKSQKILDWQIKADGANLGAAFTDGAGDRILTMTLNEPFEAIDLIVEGRVQTTDTNGVLKGHKEKISPFVYRQNTHLTARDKGLNTLAADLAKGYEPGTLDLAHSMCKEVGKVIRYQSGATDHDVTAAQALAKGEGVCQDHTHTLIALAHANGFAARYVVGYLHSDAEGNSHGASHAWCEIYIDSLGWVGFDATNGCCPDDRYLRIGSGLDAHLAAPIRGIAYGAGAEHMKASVLVEQGQQ